MGGHWWKNTKMMNWRRTRKTQRIKKAEKAVVAKALKWKKASNLFKQHGRWRSEMLKMDIYVQYSVEKRLSLTKKYRAMKGDYPVLAPFL